jgi:cell division protein FtsI/penicillin-binding protein 2
VTRRELILALAALPQGAAWAMVRVDGLRLLEEQGSARALPGSAIKPLVAMALPQNEEYRCRRLISAGGRRLDCTHNTLGTAGLTEAICHSCNDYFLQAAARLSAGRLRQVLLSYGLSALLPQTEADHSLLALGLWGVAVSPEELARAYARLALGAYPAVRLGVERAVDEGTSAAAQPAGLAVAGKTGTAPPAAWFAGWAPRLEPEIALAVYVPSGRGMTEAAPAAREIFERWAISRKR